MYVHYPAAPRSLPPVLGNRTVQLHTAQLPGCCC